MDMDMVRPWKDPCGLSPSLRPWEAFTVLTDVCGCSQPVGPPRSSCDAYACRVCHCQCGGDRRSRRTVRLVWGNGSFECGTIAARTRYWILYTLLVFTSICKSYVSVLTELNPFLWNHYCLCGKFESCGDPDPSVGLGRRPPHCSCPGYPLPCLDGTEPPHGLL